MPQIEIGKHKLGQGNPCYIIAEIGINHNGSLATTRQMIDAAVEAGCHAVKFQKRTPELCVPPEQREVPRETPWGIMSYMDYRHRVEFGLEQYRQIDQYCREKGIEWFASAWDVESVKFLEQFDPICLKVPSACCTDHELLKAYAAIGCPVIMSTGMTTMEQIHQAVSLFDPALLALAHCTSTYPCPMDQMNLRMIQTLAKEFPLVVGYSGHEVGLSTTFAAVVLGAAFVERHVTLDRAMWGSDQAASVEPGGLKRMVDNIRDIEIALGDGVKRIYESEQIALSRLRVVSRGAKPISED